MGDDEEVLTYGPRRSRRLRIVALVVAVLALGAVIVVRAWPRSSPEHDTVPAPTFPAPSAAQSSPPEQLGGRPWPTAPGACGSDAEVAIVSSVPVATSTGLHLLVGGSPLRTVDFDSGRTETVTGLPRGAFVTQLDSGSPRYAITSTCDPSAPSRLVRLTGDAHIGARPASGPPAQFVVLDGPRVWGFTSPDAAHPRGTVQLDGGSRVWLPRGFFPEAITQGVLVGERAARPGNRAGGLLLVDAVTGTVRQQLGAGQIVAVGGGVVVWSQGCDVSVARPCTVHRQAVDGGSTATYRLPRPPGFFHGVVAADGRRVAFTLERPHQDRRYRIDHPIPPADVAILDLGTGALHIVPGVELAAKDQPGLAFAADGRWLVLALNVGVGTRVLAWHPGLAHPLETEPVAGPAMSPPAVAVLSSRAGG